MKTHNNTTLPVAEYKKQAIDTIHPNEELILQNTEKEERASELIIANIELVFQNKEKEKRAAELIIANKELVFQNDEKEKRAAELIIANKELAFQNKEKEKLAAELIIANKELVFQSDEKEKRAAELINANRIYTFLSQVNQAIVHSKNEQMLFNEVCRIAIHIGKFELSAISFSNKTNNTLKNITHYNARPDDIEFLDNFTYDTKGPTAKVLLTGKPYIINNYAHEPEIENSKKYALDRGFRSCILLPIKKAGKTVGVYNIFSANINSFDQVELALLEEAAGDISFALDVFEKEMNRAQMEGRLIHSELRLQQAQSIAHFGSWELDLSNDTMLWSDEACQIYGFPLDDNIQSYASWLSYTHPDDIANVMSVTKEGEKTLSKVEFHHRIIRRDGAVRHIYSQAQFEFNKEGKAVVLYGVGHDITETKEAETERTKIIGHMVQRNNDLEQFSYIVSHNLRAPVANILGLVSIIQTIGIDKGEEKKVTGYLAAAAQNLDNVIIDINHILELKNNRDGKRERIIFEQLLNEVKLSVENNNDEQANIIGNFTAIEEITSVKSYLYSIFFNLISNSIKYRRPGIVPVIKITSCLINNKIQLSFKDNGLGIDLKKNSKEVFGLYKRFHHHLEGKGMGLFMVKTQVESLGGKITVTSDVNKGSEFKLEFEIDEK